jgi:prepilin-type N-terminal cleavage/methylation domain-containing protein/prepilin-type processing-associated H-X9-DG protein
MARFWKRPRDGFTLIELLVVIAIIAILIGLLVPAVQKVRAAAARSQCQSQLKQLALACHTYHDANKNLPQNMLFSISGSGTYGTGNYGWSWIAMILPYIEQGNLYTGAGLGNKNAAGQPTSKLNVTVNGVAVIATPIPVLRCPSDPDVATTLWTDRADVSPTSVAITNYKGVAGANWQWGDGRWNPGWQGNTQVNVGSSTVQDGLENGNGLLWRSMGFYGRKFTLLSITDGASNTFMIGESMPSRCQWTGAWAYANNATGTCAIYPNALTSAGLQFAASDWPNCYSFHSAHGGGVQFAMGDGSVRFVSDGVDIPTYRAMATLRGGEALNLTD